MATKVTAKTAAIRALVKGLTPKRLEARLASAERKLVVPSLRAKSRKPTAETLEAPRELKTGKLTRYVDEDDMFKKLGVKVGKT